MAVCALCEYDYGHKQINLIPFICDTLDELPFLTEHIAFKWVQPEDLKTIDFSGADVFVADSYLERIACESNSDTHTNDITGSDPEPDDNELQAMVNKMMSMKEAEWVALSAIENQAIFIKLLEYSYSSDKKLAFRASWTVSKVCDKFPGIIHPYLPRMIDSLSNLENESTLTFISQDNIPYRYDGDR